MIFGMDYYALVRTTDPTYGPYGALRDYIRDHPDFAIDLAFTYSDDAPFDDFALDMEIKSLSGWDAFQVGRSSTNYDPTRNYHRYDGCGGIQSMSDREVEEWARDYVLDELASDIVYGNMDIPEDLEEILALWGPNGRELCKKYLDDGSIGSRNAKKRGRFRWMTSS